MNWKLSGFLVFLSVCGSRVTCVADDVVAVEIDLEPYRQVALDRWQSEIEKLEARDATEIHPDDGVLFVGSSSIRLWSEISTDMQPYHAIQRGYGGAKWSDVAVFVDRLVRPHTFRAVVFFVANDISGRDGDKTPQEVARLFAYVLARVREHNANAPVFYIAVTPTRSRLSVWPQIRRGNSLVRAFCETQEDAYFIGTESIFLDARGEPRDELFQEDRLHLNRGGYVRWAAAVKSQLDTVLNGATRGERPK